MSSILIAKKLPSWFRATVKLDTVIKAKATASGYVATTTTAGGLIVVTHGMDVTPTVVVATAYGATMQTLNITAIDSTTFTLKAYGVDNLLVNASTVNFFWIAK